MMAGIIGVPLGSFLAQRLRHRFPAIDPQICAYGLLVSGPLVFFSLLTSPYSTALCMFFVFCAQLSLNLTWSIVADILLVRQVVWTTLETPECRKNFCCGCIECKHWVWFRLKVLMFIQSLS